MGQRNPVFDPDLLKAGLILFGLFAAILVGAALIQLLRRAYLGPDDSEGELAEAIREAHLAGTLNDAEFRRAMEVLSQPPALPTKVRTPLDDDSGESP